MKDSTGGSAAAGPLPFATRDLPGVPALFKAVPEDFRVDELPAYLPSGEGEHVFVRVEKRGRDTREVVAELSRALRFPERDVGVAGLKDRHAVTTQWLSLARIDPAEALTLAGEGWRVLEAARHGNKLRTGHLRGNRFRILLRGVDEAGAVRANAIAEALRQRGLPNYFGPQRFGRSGDNAEVGRLLLLGKDDPRARRALRDHRMRRFLVSAFQSGIFNRVLAARLEEGTWATPLEGDVLQKLPAGGLFVCAEPSVDLPRVASFECSITGPLPGAKVRPSPVGEPARLEDAILAETGVGPEHLAASRDAMGARRALRLPLALSIEREDNGIRLEFELPPGTYATSVIRELTKAGPPPELDGAG
ncbi:tRNA pseudouridine(13) synthase TruD [Vulgatibacter incomptus]|uniref:tRNA pseudouridine synthase D n=1 Tax=Vulgatibacter incomptus TaxID=1391653 RepID=A0A0K1P8Z9_9BACT|nr:tRNA pseudouridine(13) synthase TruD [Vulgatibacter incomptus]AKU90000.1 tRNA pseudouridine 13 synthase [Vulgatibacter incomptus]